MHLRCCVDESDLLVVLALATSQLRAEPGSYFNRCVAFIGNEQNDESVTGKNGVEGGLFHVVLETMDVTDGYPYLQVQLTGNGLG